MAQTTTTFSFDERTEKIIDQLKRDFGAASKAEVIRKAIALLEVVRQARLKGEDVAVVDADAKKIRKVLVL